MLDMFFSFGRTDDELPQIGASGLSSRPGLVTTVLQQHRVRQRILEPYRHLKKALQEMQDDYLCTKQANPIVRYIRLQRMVRQVALLDSQYWKLLEIPTQLLTEDNNSYVLRVMTVVEEKRTASTSEPPPKAGISALLGASMLGKAAECRSDQVLVDSIKAKSTDQLRKECELLYTQLHRLIKKYIGLRKLVHELHDRYERTRLYPVIPRHSLLKQMVKLTLRSPEFADICHEQVE